MPVQKKRKKNFKSLDWGVQIFTKSIETWLFEKLRINFLVLSLIWLWPAITIFTLNQH